MFIYLTYHNTIAIERDPSRASAFLPSIIAKHLFSAERLPSKSLMFNFGLAFDSRIAAASPEAPAMFSSQISFQFQHQCLPSSFLAAASDFYNSIADAFVAFILYNCN